MHHKVVLDANIFISFLISHRPPISTIIDIWKEGKLVVCYSGEVLGELEKGLKYPKIRKSVTNIESEALLDVVRTFGILVTPTVRVGVCRDKKDNKYLEACIESGSAFLVSGDKDLLALTEFKNIKIVSPYDFVKMYNN